MSVVCVIRVSVYSRYIVACVAAWLSGVSVGGGNSRCVAA